MKGKHWLYVIIGLIILVGCIWGTRELYYYYNPNISNIASTEDNNKNLFFYGTDSNTETDYISSEEGGNDDAISQIAVGEVATKEGILGVMLVKNILTDSDSVAVPKEDADVFLELTQSSDWNEGTTDCFSNCEIEINGEVFRYHSDCGTFNDNEKDRSLTVDEETKTLINNILSNYIDLSSKEVPIE